MGVDNVLEMSHVTKRYPGVVALDDVSFNLRRGEVHALVGENGAGKSTLIKILSGSTNPSSGTITIDGTSYGSLTPRDALAEGVCTVYQDSSLVPSLSVAENVFLGHFPCRGAFVERGLINSRTRELLGQLGVDIDVTRSVESVSPAMAQFVAIAKALAQDVRVLIMDEATAPLTDSEADVLLATVGRLKARGVSVIYITHRLSEVYRVADRMTIMRDGRIIETAEPQDIGTGDLIRLIAGRQISQVYPSRTDKLGDPVLKVDGLSAGGVSDVSFTLRKGEILGFAGLMGSGRTEMARALFGAESKYAGEVELNGQKVDIKSPSVAVKLGIGYVPKNRQTQGVLLERNVRENISLANLRRLCRHAMLDESVESGVVGRLRESLGIKTPSDSQLVRNLSGGNQQKVALGKWLAGTLNVLILDEPTQGIDVGSKHEIYEILNDLTCQGVSILMLSSETEELMGMANRIIVMHEGRIAGVIEDSKDYSQERIMRYASGVVEQ
jgi:ribose transport system ATP-binding protein